MSRFINFTKLHIVRLKAKGFVFEIELHVSSWYTDASVWIEDFGKIGFLKLKIIMSYMRNE